MNRLGKLMTMMHPEKTRLVTPEEALPGRSEAAFEVPEHHAREARSAHERRSGVAMILSGFHGRARARSMRMPPIVARTSSIGRVMSRSTSSGELP